MQILWSVWEIVVNFLECFFISYLFRKQLGYSPNKRKPVILGLIIMVVTMTTINLANLSFIYAIMVGFFVSLLYAIVCFEGSATLKIFWGIIGPGVSQITNLIVSNLLPLFSGIDIVDTLSPSPARFGVQVFYILIVISLHWLLSRIPKKNTKIETPMVYHLVLIIIMGVGVFAVGQIVGFAIRIERSSQDRNILITISFAILAMLIAIIFLFEKIGRSSYEKAEIENQLKIAAMEEESIKRSKELIAAWHHDVNNHIEVLQQYANNNDMDNLHKRLGEMHRNIDEIIEVQSTGNPAIDACIASKLIIARANKIQTIVSISRIGNCVISDSEISIVLGNLLTNAIEACQGIIDENSRYIDISVQQIKNMIHIDILNSSNGTYSYSRNRLKTIKTEPNHGKGLAGMERCLKKYNAFYQIEPGEDYFQIKLFIPTI